jgi:hypothetical protein
VNAIKNVVAAIFAMAIMVVVSGHASAQVALTDELVVGNWSADFAALLANPEMTAEERAALEGTLTSAVATMTVNADHTATYHAEMMGQVDDKAGTWALDPAAGTMTMTNADGTIEVLTVSAVDADTLIIGAGGEAVTWHRMP